MAGAVPFDDSDADVPPSADDGVSTSHARRAEHERHGDVGDLRTLAIHRAPILCTPLHPEGLASTGVTLDYVRLSAGIEHVDDILADLEQALAGT